MRIGGITHINVNVNRPVIINPQSRRRIAAELLLLRILNGHPIEFQPEKELLNRAFDRRHR
jgi:hypothetical protein